MRNHSFSRRRFLVAGASLAVAGPLACAQRNPSELHDFIRISALLTGFTTAELDEQLGQTYLDAVKSTLTTGYSLEDLFEKAGFRSSAPPQTFDALERHGLFDSDPARRLAVEILNCWYSGTVPAVGPLRFRVATYDNALAWKSITWTTPNMYCRGPLGFWSDPPNQGLV